MIEEVKKFSLLTPQHLLARKENHFILPPVQQRGDLSCIFPSNNPTNLSAGPAWALDFETTGDWAVESHTVVGCGLSGPHGSFYISFLEGHPDAYQWLMEELYERQVPLVAHNLLFDGGWPYRDYNLWLNWQHCTYALYKLLASEGFPGQQWGLKQAQQDLLGWPEQGDQELLAWLKGQGLGKSQMWRAPKEILGRYCLLDADSTYLIYHNILLPALSRFKALEQYVGDRYLHYIKLHIWQKLTGFLIDRPQLEKYNKYLLKEIENITDSIYNHPEIVSFREILRQEALEEHKKKEPARYLKMKPLGKEPARYRKDGQPSKNWQRWDENRRNRKPIVSKNWLAWEEKRGTIGTVEHFNPNSGPQKQRLFYNHLASIQWRFQTDRKESVVALRYGNNPTVFLPATDMGQPPLDKKALRVLGPVGGLFLRYADKVKEQQYVFSCLQVINNQDILRPGFRVPGTLTGRLAGGGYTVERPDEQGKVTAYSINIQQIPKSVGYLSCMIPRPGKVWVDCDHTAIEQVVLAELSKDPSLWKLYGPEAKPNDIYLFNGSSLPGLGEKIRAAGYDPDYPTEELIATVKKACKKERQAAKVVTLGSSYGMGAGKLQRTLAMEGIEVTLAEAKKIHQAYWDLYKGVKTFEQELLRQLENNDGWVLNGMGRPVGIASGYERDIINRVVQSTAHDIHFFYILIVDRLLKEAGIMWTPVILDFHDQMIVEVSSNDAERVKEIMEIEAYRELNNFLKGQLQIKGEAAIISNMAEAKCGAEEIEKWKLLLLQ